MSSRMPKTIPLVRKRIFVCHGRCVIFLKAAESSFSFFDRIKRYGYAFMATQLSEEEMRHALFGSPKQSESESIFIAPTPVPSPTPQEKPVRRALSKSFSPRLRVTLRVTREFEGEAEVFVYDANTLSTIVAEQAAKNEAKKQKFRYFDVVSIKPVES
ncbi:hypothetical protein [Pseudomonas silensiensis]|uniref:hypothetical protein n=1 Tax=Pseudomonas silensiensis TaxID=2991049 RepID=UPI003D213FA4